MKLHLDLTNGVSGDMLLAALLDTGRMSMQAFYAELDKLSIRDEFEIVVREDYKKDTRCKTVVVLDKNMFAPSGAAPGRTFKDVLRIIMSSGFSDTAKLTAVKVFENLARAEGRADKKPPLSAPFNAAEGVAAIVTVAGIAILLDAMAPERITATRVNTGSGVAYRSGGAVTIPVPAVTDLLSDVPVFSDDRECELTTPVGAAVVRTVVEEFGIASEEPVSAVGRGGGERDFLSYANVLLASVTEAAPVKIIGGAFGSVTLETEDEPPAKEQKTMPEPTDTAGAESEDDSSARKIDQIMSAMEDLEQAFSKKRAQTNEPEPAKPDVKFTQSVLLEKLKEIEAKLAAANKTKVEPPPETNDSLEKLAKLEDQYRKDAPAEAPKAASENDDVHDTGVLELTANIDGSTGEELGFLAELILANGAYDVYFEPIYTKKFRPAYKLSAVIAEKDLTLFSRLILRHSGTIGVRYTKLNHITLRHDTGVRRSSLGDVKVRRVEGRADSPLYEEKRRLALEKDLTLREIDRILDFGEDEHEE